MSRKNLFYRFIFGGAAVSLSYLVSNLLPWRMLGGIFAAFPAVMLVAVMMMGITSGSKKAAQLAQGSIYGMVGCTICVISVLLFLRLTHIWWISILLGLLLWYGSAILLYKLREKF
jgi:hypothetical protein